ncbi:MAG: cytochrome C [Cyclobacteriaceae bacterium]
MAREDDFVRIVKRAVQLVLTAFIMVIFSGGLIVYYMADPDFSVFRSEPEIVINKVEVDDFDKIENGIHVRTGLVDAEGLMTVVNNCTYCHSAKIILQNRMNTERWNATIRWMQETQNLGDLGSNQEVIVNYLVTNYPPKMIGRREILTNIDWYELKTNNN